MNRWHVYDYLKKYYMVHGRVLSQLEILEKFEGIEFEEVQEGLAEFKEIMGLVVPEPFEEETRGRIA